MSARKPKELNNFELAEIAFKVRGKLEQKWGRHYLINNLDHDFGVDVLKETYIAVREQLEKEHDRARSNPSHLRP